MKERSCCVCGKTPLSKNEIGLTKKLIDMTAKSFYCLDCLAEYLEVGTDFLQERVKEYKEQRCQFF